MFLINLDYLILLHEILHNQLHCHHSYQTFSPYLKILWIQHHCVLFLPIQFVTTHPHPMFHCRQNHTNKKRRLLFYRSLYLMFEPKHLTNHEDLLCLFFLCQDSHKHDQKILHCFQKSKNDHALIV